MGETVRELYERERERLKALWARTNPELILKDGSLLNDAEAEVAASVVDSLWDAIVIGTHEECDVCRGKNPVFMSCGCGRGKSYVVDAETVEACATAACDAYNETCEGNRDGTLDGDCAWHAAALAVLAAVDIKMADEVVVVPEHTAYWVISDDPLTTILRGDTLYIVRAVTVDCHSKGECGLPPDVSGFPDVTTGDNDEGWEDERAAAEEQAYRSGHEAGYGEGFNDARARFDRGDC